MSLLVANARYRSLFSAAAVSNLGDGIAALAIPWLATLITRDPLLIGAVAFAMRLPWFLLAIPAGVLTDRADRRRLMVQADLFRVALTLGIVALIIGLPPLPLVNGQAAIGILATLAFLLGTAEVVRDNAAQTALPAVVEAGDLERANGQLWSIEQIMGAFVGPPLAGVLIAWTLPAPFAVAALCFGLAAWVLWRMDMPARIAKARRRMWVEAVEGWTWMRQHPVILRLAVMLGVLNAASVMGLTVLVLVSQEALGLGAAEHGLLLIAGAAGGVLGGLVCPAIVEALGRQRSLMLALALFPLPMIVIALSSAVWLVAVALFAEMMLALLWNVVTVAYRQRRIPDVLLGRVNSLYRFFGWGPMPLAALAAGIVVSWAEPELGREAALRVPYWIAAAGMLGVALYGWARLRLV